MKIGTIVILENLDLQKVIHDISGLLSDHSSVEFLIGNFIANTTNIVIKKHPIIKIILNKYCALILQHQSNEEAIRLLMKDWNKYFKCNLNEVKPYKKDFEGIEKLIDEGRFILDIFIGIENGMNAVKTMTKHNSPYMWKTYTMK